MAGLQRNMQVTAHFGAAVQHLQQLLIDLAGFNRADAYAFQPIHLIQLPEQVGQAVVVQIIAVAAGVNTGQYELLVASLNQLMRLSDNRFRITAA
ncbi:hypothetical protein D3C80_1691560 [compost metagenome]